MRVKKSIFLFLLTALLIVSTVLLNKHFKSENVWAVLQGDINNDGRVDVLDFQILSNTFGKSQGQTGYNPNADLNTDNRVDVLDFQILSNNFGRTGTTPTPTAPVPTSPPGNNLTDCSSYQNPKRVFLETQAWWMSTASIRGPVPPGQIPVNGIGGHAHTATCFPQDQHIPNGTYRFNVRLMLHKGQVGGVRVLDIGLGPDGQSLARRTFDPPITCAGGSNLSTMCEMWIPIDLVVDDRIRPGYGELRFRFIIRQPNGEEQFASTAWMGYFHGSTAVYNRQPPYLQARGWYTGAEYENATLRSPFPYEPLSGTWTFRAAMHPWS